MLSNYTLLIWDLWDGHESTFFYRCIIIFFLIDQIWDNLATGAHDKVLFRLLESGYGTQRTYSEANHKKLILFFCQKQIYSTEFWKYLWLGFHNYSNEYWPQQLGRFLWSVRLNGLCVFQYWHWPSMCMEVQLHGLFFMRKGPFGSLVTVVQDFSVIWQSFIMANIFVQWSPKQTWNRIQG